jgi:hypothetical protein
MLAGDAGAWQWAPASFSVGNTRQFALTFVALTGTPF